ncbi:MAG TPA: hypothetical protein VI168_15655 [Croceibacterium sp.]
MQGEIRGHLGGKFGVVGFDGGVRRGSPADIDEIEFLPSFGIGLRFMPVKAANTNGWVEYALGQHSGALYISVGKAF